MSTGQKLIVVSVGADTTWVNVLSNASDENVRGAFKRWNRVRPVYIPVAAVIADPAVIVRVANVVRLPKTTNIYWAARFFGAAGIEPSVQSSAFRQIHRAGPMAGLLLMEWRRAVENAKEVAAR